MTFIIKFQTFKQKKYFRGTPEIKKVRDGGHGLFIIGEAKFYLTITFAAFSPSTVTIITPAGTDIVALSEISLTLVMV